VAGWCCRTPGIGGACSGRASPKTPAAPSCNWLLPLRHLVGMDIELLSQLGQGLFTLDRGQGHLRLERRCVIPAGTSAHQFSSAQPSYGCRSRELPLIPLSEFTEPALWSIYCGDRNNLLSLRTKTDFQSFSRAGASTNLRCSTTDCPAEKLSMMYGKTNRE